MPAPPNPVLARVWRGSAIESVHRGAVAVVRPGGEIVYAAGDIEAPQCLRSTAKPFQAMAALEVFFGDGFEVSDAEIAVISSSHSGQPLHVGLVRGLLRRAAIPESKLLCGSHPPMHHASAMALVRAGEEPSALHNNCSGKHAAMLIAAQIRGAPLDSYLDCEHPVQIRNQILLAKFAGMIPEYIGVEVDGCSAPTFILPLLNLARAYAALTDMAAVDWNFEVRRRWTAAVAREPLAYAGEGRPCTKFLSITKGTVYPKIGAEGMYTVGIHGSVGIATKFDDGGHRATEALIATLLLRHGPGFRDDALEQLRCLREVPLKNHRGLVVGRIEVTLP